MNTNDWPMNKYKLPNTWIIDIHEQEKLTHEQEKITYEQEKLTYEQENLTYEQENWPMNKKNWPMKTNIRMGTGIIDQNKQV